MITIPSKRPKTLRAFEVDFGTTISEAIWDRVIQAINWYNDALPIGSILPFYQQQTFANGDPVADPMAMFQYCDGAAVGNVNSPLFGQNLPDLRDFFLKGGPIIGLTGGNLSLNLSHSHGGFTGIKDDTDSSALRIDDGAELQEGHAHRHSMFADLGVQSLVPPYIDLQYYMKVDGAATIDALLGYTQIDDDYSKFGRIVSTEFAQLIKLALDYISSAMPIGDVMPIMTDIPGVVINPKIWQECDGSEIVDPDSPLHTTPGTPRFTPNMVDRYVKFPTIGLVGLAGGSNTRSDMGHNHGGITDSNGYDDNADLDNDHFPSTEHRHSISTDLASVYNVEPPYKTVKFFMRIQ